MPKPHAPWNEIHPAFAIHSKDSILGHQVQMDFHDLSPAVGNYPGSSMYGLQKSGPMEDYALADLYSWLESHSGQVAKLYSATLSIATFHMTRAR